MVLGVDTDVLVHWAMADAPRHRAVRRLFDREVGEAGHSLGLTLQVLFEFLHVVTDSRRFEKPLEMRQALDLTRELWGAPEVMRIRPTVRVYPRACELIEQLGLGRKQILDTALAATLEAAGIHRLATLNRRDFAVFPFIEVVEPGPGPVV